MGKIVICLHLPEPKVRKPTAKAVQKHKDKTKYTRKCQHEATESGGLMLGGRGRAQSKSKPATIY